MAGKKKAAKKVAKKVAKKTGAKRGPKPKPENNDHDTTKKAMAALRAHMEQESQEQEQELAQNPYVYRVYNFMSDGVYSLNNFSTMEAAQDCVAAQRQLNDRRWDIVAERRCKTFNERAIHDAW